jgi:hypothetical protein
MMAMQMALKIQLIISNSHHSTNQRVMKPLAFWALDKSHSNPDDGSDDDLVDGRLPLWDESFAEGANVTDDLA